MRKSAILLAAGLSKRMGRQKLLLPFRGHSVAETALYNLVGAGFGEIVCVVSRDVAEHFSTRALPGNVKIAVNETPERGQSSSLEIALETLSDGADFCIMLADLPLVTARDIKVLMRKFDALPSGKTVLAPCRDGAFGHPMFYRAVWRDRLRDAAGDTGGKIILREFASEIERVAAPDIHFKDIDTPEDYEKLISGEAR